MKIVATSDLHGYLPEIPECDILLLAGDLLYYEHQEHFVRTRFVPWLRKVPAKNIVGIWGNHDTWGLDYPDVVDLMPVLTDRMIEVEGLRIYGVPWTRLWGSTKAFMLETPELDEKFNAVPDCDIIISHGPPFGYGDYTRNLERVGSDAFVKCLDRVRPRLAVFGHIHDHPGYWERNDTRLANVTHVDSELRPSYQPQMFSL